MNDLKEALSQPNDDLLNDYLGNVSVEDFRADIKDLLANNNLENFKKSVVDYINNLV